MTSRISIEEVSKWCQNQTLDSCCSALPEFLNEVLLQDHSSSELRTILNTIICSHVPEELLYTISPLIMGSKTNRQEGRLCGYVFQNGDIAYNCRTCQVDDTCVLCLDCFRNSAHEGHDVFFHKTKPGGICDCGDDEAWNPEGFCNKHGKDFQEQQDQEQIPASALVLGKIIISFIINYVLDTVVQSKDSFNLSTTSNINISYHLRIFNDDIHTFEFVQAILARLSHGKDEEGNEIKGMKDGLTLNDDPHNLTTKIDEEGYGLIASNLDFEKAKRLKEIVSTSGLLACIVDDAFIAKESRSISFLSWLKCFCCSSNVFIYILISSLASKDALSTFVANDPYICKPLVVLIHELYMHLLSSQVFKQDFAVAFVTHFEDLMSLYLNGIGTNKETLHNFSVQIFTTPSLVKRFVQEGLLTRIFNLFFYFLHLSSCTIPAEKIHNGDRLFPGCVDPESDVIKFKRYTILCMDLEHILTIPTVAHVLVQESILIDRWISFLMHLQGMHQQVKLKNIHVEYDSRRWILAYNLTLQISSVFPLVLKFLSRDNQDQQLKEQEISVSRIKNSFQNTFLQWIENQELSFYDVKLPPPIGIFHGIHFDLMTEPVSFHYPLHRFFAKFVVQLCIEGYTSQNSCDGKSSPFGLISCNNLKEQEFCLALLEYPLQVIVLASQIQSGMWRHNGYNMFNQMSNYFGQPLSRDLRDLDLVLLQFCALTLDFHSFLSAFFNRFQIIDYFFQLPSADDSISDEDIEEENESIGLLANDALLVLIWLLTELPPPPLTTASSESNISLIFRREIIHRLAEKPCVNSELLECSNLIYDTFSKRSNYSEDLQQLLPSISFWKEKKSTSMEPAKCQLKDEIYNEYDPSFYHLNRNQHEIAQERLLESRERIMKLEQSNGAPCPSYPFPVSPMPPLAHPEFVRLKMMLFEDAVFTLIFYGLCKVVNDTSNYTKMTLLLRIVHLLTMQVHHLKSNPNQDLQNRLFDKISASDQQIKQSVLQLIIQILDQLPNQSKFVISGIKWLLQFYALNGKNCKHFINEALSKAQDVSPSQDEKREKRLLAQKRAMAAMKLRQQAFLQSSQGLEEKENISFEQGESLIKQQNTPICIICNEIRQDTAMMYIGYAERTTVLAHTLLDETKLGQPLDYSLYLQLCGHALHLACSDVYIHNEHQKMLSRYHYHEFTSIDPRVREFLCPLCKSISNMLVPHIEEREEDYIQEQGMLLDNFDLPSPQSCISWLSSIIKAQESENSTDTSLPAFMTSVFSFPQSPSTERPFHRFADTVYQAGTSSQQIATELEYLWTLWNAFSSTVSLIDMKGISITCHRYYEYLDQGFEASKQTEQKQEVIEFFDQSLGINLGEDRDKSLDQSSKSQLDLLALLYRAIKQFPKVLETSGLYEHSIITPLLNMFIIPNEENFRNKKSRKNEQVLASLPQFQLPLLAQDVLLLLVILGSQSPNSQVISLVQLLNIVTSVQVIILLFVYSPSIVLKQQDFENIRFSFTTSCNVENCEAINCSCELIREADALLNFYSHLVGLLDLPLPLRDISKKQKLALVTIYQAWCFPFLRQSILFLRTQQNYNFMFINSNFASMRNQLGIPSLRDLLENKNWMESINMWIIELKNSSHWITKKSISPRYLGCSGASFSYSLMPPPASWYPLRLKISKLISLPSSYTDLHVELSNSTCPVTKKPVTNPAICLVCGAMLCAGSECCFIGGIGACSRHAAQCGVSSGVFFLLGTCQCLLIRSAFSAYYPSLYVDFFGEDDINCRRGRPLFLKRERMEQLHSLWLGCQIGREVTRIRGQAEQLNRPNHF